MAVESHRFTTDTCIGNVLTLLQLVVDTRDVQKRAGIIADAQHHLGWAMRSAMAECEEANQPWRAVAPVVGMPHGVLFRQYRGGGPVGFRTVGDVDDNWRVISEAEAMNPDLNSAEIVFEPAPNPGPRPFAGQRLELRYATVGTDILETLGRGRGYPLWHGELGRRPIHVSQPVFDELFGPPDVSSPERVRWVAEADRLDRLREAAQRA
jgi:hypothetical protein